MVPSAGVKASLDVSNCVDTLARAVEKILISPQP